MPTSSQWKIIKHVIESETPFQKDLAMALQNLKESEDDILEFQNLKAELEKSTTQEKRLAIQKKRLPSMGRSLSGSSSGRPVPAYLPQRTKSILCGLGFRSSDTMSKRLEQMNEGEMNSGQIEYSDQIIEEILHYHNSCMAPRKMLKGPNLKPKAVCFNYPGSDLTHLEVKRAFDRLLTSYPDIKIVTIEFQPRFKLLLLDKMDNTCRWVINFNTEWGRCRMTNRELKIRDQMVQTKRYDEIVVMEYKQFGRMNEILKIVKNT